MRAFQDSLVSFQKSFESQEMASDYQEDKEKKNEVSDSEYAYHKANNSHDHPSKYSNSHVDSKKSSRLLENRPHISFNSSKTEVSEGREDDRLSYEDDRTHRAGTHRSQSKEMHRREHKRRHASRSSERKHHRSRSFKLKHHKGRYSERKRSASRSMERKRRLHCSAERKRHASRSMEQKPYRDRGHNEEPCETKTIKDTSDYALSSNEKTHSSSAPDISVQRIDEPIARQEITSSLTSVKPTIFEKEKVRSRSGWDAFEDTTAQNAPSLFTIPGFPPSAMPAPAVNLELDAATQPIINPEQQQKYIQAQLCRIYVGSLDYSLNEDDVKKVFAAFGDIVCVDMPKEPAATRSKGFCFVEFTSKASADAALNLMQGFSLKGRSIKVGRPTVASTTTVNQVVQTPHPTSISAGAMAAVSLLQNRTSVQIDSVAGPTNSNVLTTANRILVKGIPISFVSEDLKKIFSGFGNICACDMEAPTINLGQPKGNCIIQFSNPSEARLAVNLMNNFVVSGHTLEVAYAPSIGSKTNSTTTAAAVSILPSTVFETRHVSNSFVAPNPTTTTVQSSIILLTNLIASTEVDDEIRDEVTQECERHGKVRNTFFHVVSHSSEVKIFVDFFSSSDAVKACQALNLRWFGGKQISCRLYDEDAYHAGKFDF